MSICQAQKNICSFSMSASNHKSIAYLVESWRGSLVTLLTRSGRVHRFVSADCRPGLLQQSKVRKRKRNQSLTFFEGDDLLSNHEKTVLAIYTNEKQKVGLVRERIEQIIANVTDYKWKRVQDYVLMLLKYKAGAKKKPCKFISTGSDVCFGLSAYEKIMLYPFVAGYRGSLTFREDLEEIFPHLNNTKSWNECISRKC